MVVIAKLLKCHLCAVDTELEYIVSNLNLQLEIKFILTFTSVCLSDPVEKKMKEGKRRKKRLLYLHLKLSLGLVPL